VVHCSGVYFHLEDLDDFTAGVTEVLADDGVFVVEFTPADNILRHWDIIYHEHYYFWTPYTLAQYLRQFSLFPASVLGAGAWRNVRHVLRRMVNREPLAGLVASYTT
jgi:hypothetical protein